MNECLSLTRFRCVNSRCQYKDQPHDTGFCSSRPSNNVNDQAQSFTTPVTHQKVSHKKGYDTRVSPNFDGQNSQ